MIREKPFPRPRGRGLFVWALAVVRLWSRAGFPVCLGVPAEQLREARRVLGL